MTARLPATPRRVRPPSPLDRGSARPAVPSVRQLWLGVTDRASDVGGQLLADEPRTRRIDWGRLHAAFWLLVLGVLFALVLTGGIR